MDIQQQIKSFLTGACNVLDVRDKEYGHPAVSFSRIAELWSAYLDHPVTPEDVANMMILMKVSRNKNMPKEDNWIDIAGYATLGAVITQGTTTTERMQVAEDKPEHKLWKEFREQCS